MSQDLRAYFTGVYRGFSDTHDNNPANDLAFQIDDRSEGDVAPDFCDITVRVPNPGGNRFTLELRSCPHNPAVERLVTGAGGTITPDPKMGTVNIKLTLNVKDSPVINKLAQAIRSVVGPGKNYLLPNWKWIAPRTTASLQQLARHLRHFKRQTSRVRRTAGSNSNPQPTHEDDRP